jgi:hypothetical protein
MPENRTQRGLFLWNRAPSPCGILAFAWFGPILHGKRGISGTGSGSLHEDLLDPPHFAACQAHLDPVRVGDPVRIFFTMPSVSRDVGWSCFCTIRTRSPGPISQKFRPSIVSHPRLSRMPCLRKQSKHLLDRSLRILPRRRSSAGKLRSDCTAVDRVLSSPDHCFAIPHMNITGEVKKIELVVQGNRSSMRECHEI